MTHLHRESSLAPDPDGLGDRVEEGGALTADMARIESSRGPGALGDLDDLGGLGIGAGRVDESGREPTGAVDHGRLHEAPHGRQLLGAGRSPGEAHGGQSQRAVTDQLRDVEGEPFVLVAAEEVLHRDP